MRYFSIQGLSLTADDAFIVLHLPAYHESDSLPTLKMLNETVHAIDPHFVYSGHLEFNSEAELRTWQNDKERPLIKIGFSLS